MPYPIRRRRKRSMAKLDRNGIALWQWLSHFLRRRFGSKCNGNKSLLNYRWRAKRRGKGARCPIRGKP